MTQPEPFVFSGADRQIFIQALRAYSDSCELPLLTPMCPFYERTSQGPSCGEQCHDLLAAHQPDGPQRLKLVFGDGIELVERPRRHRKGPEPTARPFDAGAIYMHDRHLPTDSRHTVSLIKDLEDNLRQPPSHSDDLDERSYLVKAYVQELTRRGFAYEELFRLAVAIVSASMVAYMAADSRSWLAFR